METKESKMNTRQLLQKFPLLAFAAALALPAAATIDRWGYTSYLWQPAGEGPHYYNEAANYESEHKPVSFEGVYYTSGGTVKIPVFLKGNMSDIPNATISVKVNLG